jgi:hypothetical protein
MPCTAIEEEPIFDEVRENGKEVRDWFHDFTIAP